MFFNYFEAVVMNHWLPLLIGLLGSMPWWARALLSPRLQDAIDRYFSPSGLKYLAIICLATSFIFANYSAWTEQNFKTINLQQQIDSFSKPHLMGTIDTTRYGDSGETNATLLFMLISIRNSGAPSMVEGFNLSAKGNNINLTGVIPTFIPEGFHLSLNKQEIAKFSRNEAL